MSIDDALHPVKTVLGLQHERKGENEEAAVSPVILGGIFAGKTECSQCLV